MLARLALSALLSIAACGAWACDGRLVDDGNDVGGPICVPEEPKRIVVLDPTYSLGMSLELDLPVVGAPLFGMSDRALQAEAKARSVTDLGGFTEPSLETIIALEPDLILGSGFVGTGVQEMLSGIAPTVLNTSQNWKDFYRLLAEITGRSERAEELLAGYETRLAEVRASVPEVAVSVIRITGWDFQVYLDTPNSYGPFLVLREAGVHRTPYETSDGTGPRLKRPDLEDLSALSGDILLYIVGGANDSDTSGRHDEVLANPLWQMLPAVKSGNVHRVDAATWMEFSGVTSAHRVLDDIERFIVPGP